MQDLNYSELEQEIGKLTRAMMVRNTIIGQDLIANLKAQFVLRDVAGMLIVSLERLIWSDEVSFCWAVENLIPNDVMQEIRNITSITVCKRLIHQGFTPGQDFSVGSNGVLLLNAPARIAMFG